MTYAKDLTGMRFGRLTVESRNFEKQKEVYIKSGVQKAYWNCICDCGNKNIVTSSSLKNKINPTLSCGCLKDEVIHKQKNTKDNIWILDDEIAAGITSNGAIFYIDREDYDTAKCYCWRTDAYEYIVANSRNGSNKIIRLHHVIMGLKNKDIIVDHKNWCKRDNRKSNLRIATKSENNINIKRKSNNTSGYTGVTYNKRLNRYVARISKNGKRIFLGAFHTFEEAVKARHEAELKLHQEWSGEINRKDYTNIINSQ